MLVMFLVKLLCSRNPACYYCKAQCKLKQPSYFISQFNEADYDGQTNSSCLPLNISINWVMLLKSIKNFNKCFLLFGFLDLKIYTSYHYCYRYHTI